MNPNWLKGKVTKGVQSEEMIKLMIQASFIFTLHGPVQEILNRVHQPAEDDPSVSRQKQVC